MRFFVTFSLFTVLFFQMTVLASPRILTRGDDVWPDVNWGAIFSGVAGGLEGLDLLLQPDESDESETVPQPDAISASATSQAAPTSPPGDSSSNSEPVQKLEIHNDPSPAPNAGAGTETLSQDQRVKNRCDSSTVSVHTSCDSGFLIVLGGNVFFLMAGAKIIP